MCYFTKKCVQDNDCAEIDSETVCGNTGRVQSHRVHAMGCSSSQINTEKSRRVQFSIVRLRRNATLLQVTRKRGLSVTDHFYLDPWDTPSDCEKVLCTFAKKAKRTGLNPLLYVWLFASECPVCILPRKTITSLPECVVN